MKFGQELENNIYEPWRLEYVAYDDIKNDLKRRQQDHEWNINDEKDFEIAIRLEAEKIDFFVSRKQKEIDSRIAYCERTLTQQTKNITPAIALNLYDSTDDALTEILMDLNDLSKFTRYNVLAIQKLIKKHDKYTKFNAQPLFVDVIRSKSLDKQRFDIALVKVSALHDICQLHGKERTGNSAAGGDQNAFERATAKYWIHPDNITELKAILLFHLPVLVFNNDKPIEAEDSAISSVYFDNPDFDLYQGRLQRDEGAEAIRFRWYGPMKSNNIFIERKTHHASWLNGASVKDRFRLDVNKVNGFVKGRYTANQYAEDLKSIGTSEDIVKANHFIASGIQKSILEKNLEPVMRIFYNRTAFQIPGDQRLRISLDTDLTFVREDGLQDRRKGNWRRPDMGIDYPFENLKQNEVCRFPYAVLETKLQTHLGQEPPQWLTKLLESNLVYEVPRFSKYLQGASFFWNSRLPLLPWWLSQLDGVDIRNAKQSNSNFTGLSRSKSLKPLIDGKYRMGYLESQLERSSTLKRKPSKGANLARTYSNKSTKSNRNIGDLSFIAGSSLSRVPSVVKSVRPTMTTNSTLSVSNVTNNPFDDPFWKNNNISLDTFSYGLHDSYIGSSSTTRNRIDARRTPEFQDSASTEQLMGRQPSPYNNRNTKDSSTLYIENVADLEEGKINFADEMKKNKKNQGEKEVVARIEPKIFFANERTFINWLQFAAIILTAALTLLNFGDSVNRIVGAVFFVIAFLFAVYAFGFFRWRAYRIRKKPHLRYDDIFGPVFLCVLLIGALVLNFVLRWRTAPGDNNYLGINTNTSQTNNTL